LRRSAGWFDQWDKKCLIADMTVTLPDDIPALRQMTEVELRRELALALYVARRITLVQAADIGTESLFDFQALLRDRRVPQHYDENDFQSDLMTFRQINVE
jgi:predicted HTH domain antitoxin